MPEVTTRSAATLTDAEISRLAREIARDIKAINEILKDFKLTADQFEVVADMGFFQQRLAEEAQLWNASDPVAIDRRVVVKTGTMIEDMLIEAYRLFHDPAQPLAGKVEMLKWASRIAGFGEANKQGSTDGGVKITINVGSEKIEFDKEKPGLPKGVTDVIDLTPSNAT